MSRRFRYLVSVLAMCAAAAGCNGPSQPTSIFVTGISPNAGSMLGGTQVTISGGGFKSPRPHTRASRGCRPFPRESATHFHRHGESRESRGIPLDQPRRAL